MDLSSISTGNPKIDHLLAILGVVVTASSALAGFLNARIRAALDDGSEVPAPFLYMALLCNYLAVNLDKAGQISRLLKGAPVTVLKVARATAGDAPAAPAATPSTPPPADPPKGE
jgi:hypothetical protein